MKVLSDFICHDCKSTSEKLVLTNTRIIECSKCGGKSYKQIGMPTVQLEGITGSFPDAHAKWARIREDNAKIKAKRV